MVDAHVDVKGLVITITGVFVGTALVSKLSGLARKFAIKVLIALGTSLISLWGAERIEEPRLKQFVQGIGYGGLATLAMTFMRRVGIEPLPPQRIKPEEEETKIPLPPEAGSEEKGIVEKPLEELRETEREIML